MVRVVTIIILFSFVTGSIIVGGLSFRSSQNLKTPSTTPATDNADDEIGRWQEAVKLNPQDPFALRNLARAEMRAGKFPEAKKALEEAVKYSPKDPLTYELLGQLSLAMGKGADGVAQFQKALALKPGDVMLTYELALAYSLFGDPASALTYYRQVVQKTPRSKEGLNARFAMVGIYKEQGNFKNAEKEALNLEASFPNNPQIISTLVDIYEKEKDWRKAIFNAEKLRKLEPSDTTLAIRLAGFYEKSGDWMEAQKIWADLISKSPQNPDYKYQMAVTDKKTGKNAEAKDLLERAQQEATEEKNKTLIQKIEAEVKGL